MRINKGKKSGKNKKGNSNGPKKFLYERQTIRKNNRKSEEDFMDGFSDDNSQFISQSDSENPQENEQKNSSENSEQQNSSENSQEENEPHSDSDSEGEIYKEKTQENLKNSNFDLNEINLTEEDKEKINTSYLESIENCKDLKKKIEMTKDFIKNKNNETEFGLSYLDSKNGMMIMYETYLIIYSMMKFGGVNLEKNLNAGKDFDFNKDDNIMKNLITCRTFLEKTKNIDFKLKNQIERFIKISEQENDGDMNKNLENEEDNEKASRPKILDEDDSEESEEETKEENKKSTTNKKKSKSFGEFEEKKDAKNDLKYKVKKNFQEFFETKEDNSKRQRKITKLKDKIKDSEYYKSLKEDFTDKPTEQKEESGHYEKLMKDVEEYEDERMMRIKLPKHVVKSAKKKDREEFSMKDLGLEFKQFDRIMKNDMKEEVESQKKYNKFQQITGADKNSVLGKKRGPGLDGIDRKGKGKKKFRK